MNLNDFNQYLFSDIISYLCLDDIKSLTLVSNDVRMRLLELKFQSLKVNVTYKNTNKNPYYSDYIGILYCDIFTNNFKLTYNNVHTIVCNNIKEDLVNNLPTSLTSLSFSYSSSFNQPIDQLPKTLTSLILGWKFNQPIDQLPKTLTILQDRKSVV